MLLSSLVVDVVLLLFIDIFIDIEEILNSLDFVLYTSFGSEFLRILLSRGGY